MAFPYLDLVAALPNATQAELDGLVAKLNTFLAQQHRADGSHGAITADSLTIRGQAAALGSWTDVPFRALDYTASGAMTWTVASGNQVIRRFTRIGDTVAYNCRILSTNVGGVAGTELRIALPNGLICAGYTVMPALYIDAGGANAIGLVTAFAGNAYVFVTTLAVANWTLTAGNNTAVVFTVTCEVTG